MYSIKNHVIIIFSIFIFMGCKEKNSDFESKLNPVIYEIILKDHVTKVDQNNIEYTERPINKEALQKLNEPLKAITALYAATAGTDCFDNNCRLTNALGLGEQGSEKHKYLLKKYFPNDEYVKFLLSQNCYLRNSGANTFSEIEYLTIQDFGNKVIVHYKIMTYDRYDIKYIKDSHIYEFKDNKFKNIKRNKIFDHQF